MLNPISTYRIQFHTDFTFADFKQIIPYLKQLGISTIYASPILEAVPGSMHGYDTVNPHRINPEIGTLEELKEISAILKESSISWIQDIVPNHMSFHPNNTWLMDVLEKGQKSDYAGLFDINWSGDKNQPLMVPFLGSTLEEAIEKKEIELIKTEGKLKLKYFDNEWPVNQLVADVNMPLQEVIDLQYYRPCHWEETNERINYRRFFTVNSLICLNIQQEKNFDLYHELIKTLVEEDVFQGLRVDHIDGLYDPETYLERLRDLAGPDVYIIIEKILEKGEELSASWPVEGTTGYDFLAQANNLFTNRHAKKEFTRYYQQLVNDEEGVDAQILKKKAAILVNHMAGELSNLQELFVGLKLASSEELAKLKPGKLQEAIGHLLVYCPVYRFYGSHLPLVGDDHRSFRKLLKKTGKVKGLAPAVKLLENILLVKAKAEDDEYKARATVFYLRLMQFSGPLMAKGVEDTLMYTYNRFIAHNEVGDAPDAFGMKKDDFHYLMTFRQVEWPLSLNATSTHDTKRGEDVRARLNVLTDIPEEWLARVKEWRQINAELSPGLDPNDEYFIYQTIIGSYPMPGAADHQYTDRLQAYLQKALREGKVNSDWATPDTGYEQMVTDFITAILEPSSAFLQSFIPFHAYVADFGMINSLSQLLLKFTAPGVPDVYQGTELWDLSLVDPDNRRPVDYEIRKRLLDNSPVTTENTAQDFYSGKIKISLLQSLLKMRHELADFFHYSKYIPLKVKGKHARHLFAFARKQEEKWLVTILPLHLAQLEQAANHSINWKDTHIVIPEEASFQWKDLMKNKSGIIRQSQIMVKDFFDQLPFGLIMLEQLESPRSAGILMHITSLPSPYGIGDLLEAEFFVNFLRSSGQKYWQLLPLNPIGKDQGFSPYSSVSAMAGNVLLISPDLLTMFDLLDEADLKIYRIPLKDQLNYQRAATRKDKMLRKAYQNFNDHHEGFLISQFAEFCDREGYWLNDFALFMILKERQGDAPWFEWEVPYRDRDPQAILEFSLAHEGKLTFVKWQQFLFFKQWADLKSYANFMGIELYGDLPIYVGHDSADVWSNRELFSVDAEGKLIAVAGVPPDYFNDEGQRWGMPVYNWDKLKEQNYDWWLMRLRKNMEMYDLLRLDHFRAFNDFWEVPAKEKTAVNGHWRKGPGEDFFEVLLQAFPNLPFIAEDLGEITDGVHELREGFGLAGMKVLQFAFGKDMSVSDYIPHNFSSDNYVVYTGTHDNDTTVGWYRSLNKLERKNLDVYAGVKVTIANVHIVLSKMAYASMAKIAILPMQDVLGLGTDARMNEPGVKNGNWKWVMRGRPGKDVEKRLRDLVRLYGRG